MKRRILFVDDEPNVLSGLRRLLHDQRDVWDMSFASSADEALRMIAERPPDVIVTDVNMPGKSGLELLAELKGAPPTQEIGVAVLTGLKEKDLKRRALELGATDLLDKPVHKDDLIARLNNMLRMKSYREELQAKNAALEKELARSQKMELVGVLASGVVHDVNNILTIIMGYSELAMHHLDDQPSVRRDIEWIATATERAGSVLQQILTLSAGREASRQLMELGAVIDVSLQLLKPSMPSGVEVQWDGPQTDLLIRADSTQMYQLIMNLCLNASQAMSAGGVLKIDLTKTDLEPDSLPSVQQVRPGTYLKLDVSDTGEGMDQIVLDRLFDPLFTTKSLRGGTGLGLFVVQKIAKDHGGLITVQSTPGKGASFFVYLPCAAMRSA